MKIALVHSRLLRKGGLETRLFSYIESFRKAGHQVTVIVYKVDPAIRLPEDVRLIHINLNPIPRQIRILFFDHFLKKVVTENRFDFVLSLERTSHQDAVLVPGNHRGFMKSRGKRIGGLNDWMKIWMDKKAYTSPGILFACSQMMKDEVIRYYGIPASKIEVLFPPIDNRRFHIGLRAHRTALREKYGLDPAKKSFLFVSSSHYRKGLPVLLEVFKSLVSDPCELIVAGVGRVDTALPNVKDLGFVSATEELYAAADYLVLPATYEPFGQVVVEAIQCGMPVLISDMVGAKEVVSEREGMLVPDFSPQTWKNAIREVVQRQFEIDPMFAVNHKLRLEDHIQRILIHAEKKVMGVKLMTDK